MRNKLKYCFLLPFIFGIGFVMNANYFTYGAPFGHWHWLNIRQFLSVPFISVLIVNVIPLPFYVLIRLTTGNRELAINWFVKISYCISFLLFFMLFLNILGYILGYYFPDRF